VTGDKIKMIELDMPLEEVLSILGNPLSIYIRSVDKTDFEYTFWSLKEITDTTNISSFLYDTVYFDENNYTTISLFYVKSDEKKGFNPFFELPSLYIKFNSDYEVVRVKAYRK